MGGDVLLALNLAVFPDCLPEEVVAEIIRGGADKIKEAGGVIAGGHTVEGPEPLFGMAVLGVAGRAHLWTKGGAQPGDWLLLTKPLGVGIVTTAAKAEAADPTHVAEATRWMSLLNRSACLAARRFAVHACTDITGFSVLGHACEMACASNAQLELRFSTLPFVPGAIDYAKQWLFPAGTANNEKAFRERVHFAPELAEEMRLLLFTPETSGGLLLAMPPEDASALLALPGAPAIWHVGAVSAGEARVCVS